jgi:hypothetical protein
MTFRFKFNNASREKLQKISDLSNLHSRPDDTAVAQFEKPVGRTSSRAGRRLAQAAREDARPTNFRHGGRNCQFANRPVSANLPA